MSRARGLGLLLLVYLVVGHVVPAPAAVSSQGWRQTAIFVTVIAGMVTEPIPASALVLVGLAATVANGTAVADALGGFAEPSVWLVLAAMLIARAMLDSGLARRIALVFVRAFGRTTLGVSYALQMTDVTLAAGVPSITARSAGIILPVARSIAELFDSRPGPTAARLGTFLIAAMYQGSAVACAMFLTGQASNLLGARLAGTLAGVEVSWTSWFVAALVPGLLSCAVAPWVAHACLRPSVTGTPEAAAFAARELGAMGTIGRREAIALAVFASVGALWITSAWHGLDVAAVALGGLAVLLVTGTLAWDTALAERPAWDVFVWYGGMLRLGELLNATGSTRALAEGVAGALSGVPWAGVLLAILVIYYYAHYLFASITAHLLAMFPPFVAVLIGVGVPAPLAVYSLLCLANLTAGLTHYGTTSGPILFGTGYVTRADWWRVGFYTSLCHVAIWLTAGAAWWKWLGYW